MVSAFPIPSLIIEYLIHIHFSKSLHLQNSQTVRIGTDFLLSHRKTTRISLA